MNLTIFKYQQKEIRTILDLQNNPWFVAKDVFDLLEISWKSHDSIATLSDSMKKKIKIDTVNSGVVEIPTGTWLINEAGVYKVVFRSNKPEAEKFTDWIATEVLPSIRKNGGYISPSATETQLTKLTNTLETILVNQQQQIEELKEQTKLIPTFFDASKKHKGCSEVIKYAMDDTEEEDEDVYLTVVQWLSTKGITLSQFQLNTLRKRAAQFLRTGKRREPEKRLNRTVYHKSEFCYLEQALASTLNIFVF